MGFITIENKNWLPVIELCTCLLYICSCYGHLFTRCAFTCSQGLHISPNENFQIFHEKYVLKICKYICYFFSHYFHSPNHDCTVSSYRFIYWILRSNKCTLLLYQTTWWVHSLPRTVEKKMIACRTHTLECVSWNFLNSRMWYSLCIWPEVTY